MLYEVITIPFDVSPGDLLFRVGGGGRAEATRSARRAREALPPGGVRFRIAVGDGALAVEASYGKAHGEFSFRVSGAGTRREGKVPPDAEARLRAAYRSDLPLGEIVITSYSIHYTKLYDFRADTPILDANAKRVIARLFCVKERVSLPSVERRLWTISRGLIPPGKGRETALALMDLGATVCVPRRPHCPACPLKSHCEGHRDGIQSYNFV